MLEQTAAEPAPTPTPILPHAPTSPATSAAIDRRGFIGAAAGAAALLAAHELPALARARRADEPRVARSVIFFVADGMSTGTLHLGDLAVRRKTGKPSNWVSLLADPRTRRALMDTSAADSLVTDSAAASTGWGTGRWANNGAIGLIPDGSMPTPILVHAKQAGKAAGLVTSTRLTHATPAGFACNSELSRDREEVLAPQLVEREIDVLLGGGSHFLTSELQGRAAGAALCDSRAALLALAEVDLRSRRLIGVFTPQHMSYEIDRTDAEPSLAEMTRVALSKLAAAPGGFVLQVEGGRIDHAAHDNDAPALIRDQVAFDEALGVCLAHVQEHPDTLLIVTTDHGCANPALTDYGVKGNEGFEALLRATRSNTTAIERLRADESLRTAEGIARTIESTAGVRPSGDEAAALLRRLSGEPVDLYRSRGSFAAALGSVLANHFAVAFISVNHTSDFVPCLALGPGSERLEGFHFSRELHELMIRALDLPPAKPV